MFKKTKVKIRFASTLCKPSAVAIETESCNYEKEASLQQVCAVPHSETVSNKLSLKGKLK